MQQVIAYDVLRLFIGPASRTPRGIDRVDLALAQHLFSDPAAPHVGILPTPAGTFALSAAQVARLLDHLSTLWSEEPNAGVDRPLATLIDALTGTPVSRSAAPGRSAPLSLARMSARMVRMLGSTACVPHRSAVKAVPYGAQYVNVGQLGLAMPAFFRWLDKRPDIVTAIMVHDTIPLLHPHLVPPTSPAYHARMIATAVERADCMIYNSLHTQESVDAEMMRLGRSRPPSLVRALPLPSAFLHVEASHPALAGIRYFITVSTVEPRKNHALLLRVWRSLLTEMGDATPHLVIVGSQGHDAEQILAPLAADPALAGRVHHVVGLSSTALSALLLGAAGLLCPSLAEGFGLPLLEAEALHVPAIVSDIPSHREIAGTSTILLSVDTDRPWETAVLDLLERDHTVAKPRRRPAIPDRLTEASYCADVLDYVAGASPTARAWRGAGPGQ